MLKQSMPLPLEQEGIKHTKLDKLPIGQNRRRYRVSYNLLLKLSLSSPFLSAKNHTANINLLYCDFVLLTLMVSLFPFPRESFVRNLGTRFFLRGVGCDIPDFKILSKKY